MIKIELTESEVAARRLLARTGNEDVIEALGLLGPGEVSIAAIAGSLRGRPGRSQIQSRARGAR